MRTVEAPSAGVELKPPVRPGILRVGWATFTGYLWALLFLLPVGIAAYLLGIDALGLSDSTGRGVFYRFDVWSYLAEACVGVFVTGVTAFSVRHQLIRNTGWEVPFGFAFAVIFLTGYAPAAALTPLYGATALVSLLIATIALRWRCEPSGAEPMGFLSGVPTRHRRRVATALAIGVPAMACYALAYGATHPLRWDGSVAFSPNGTAQGDDPPRYQRDPGAIERYVFPVQNLGRLDVDDMALTAVEGNPVFQLESAGVIGAGRTSWGRAPWAPHRPLNPLSDVQFPAGATRYIVLEFRQGPTCVGRIAQLEAVRLRFSVLGGSFVELIPLDEPPTIRC
jgi:hypothetical protein